MVHMEALLQQLVPTTPNMPRQELSTPPARPRQDIRATPLTSMASIRSKMHFQKPPTWEGLSDPQYWLLDIEEDFERDPEYFLQEQNKVFYASRNLKEDSVVKRHFQLVKL